MVQYDAISKRALSVLEVKSETIELYRQEVAALPPAPMPSTASPPNHPRA